MYISVIIVTESTVAVCPKRRNQPTSRKKSDNKNEWTEDGKAGQRWNKAKLKIQNTLSSHVYTVHTNKIKFE